MDFVMPKDDYRFKHRASLLPEKETMRLKDNYWEGVDTEWKELSGSLISI